MEENIGYSIMMEPVEPAEFKKVTGQTDKKGFLAYGTAVLLFMPFLVYYSNKASDINRILYYSDSCLNFCGTKNFKIYDISCSGQDYSDKRYLSLGRCVHDCPPNSTTVGAFFAYSYACYVKEQRPKPKNDSQSQFNWDKDFQHENEKERDGKQEIEEETETERNIENEEIRNKIKKYQFYKTRKNRPNFVYKSKFCLEEPCFLHQMNWSKTEHKNELSLVKLRFKRNGRNGEIQEPLEQCRTWWTKFFYIGLVITGICLISLLLLRFCPMMILACTFVFTLFVIYLSWILYGLMTLMNTKNRKLIVMVPILSIFLHFILVLIPCIFWKQIKLITHLFQETAKTVLSNPRLLLFTMVVIIIQLAALKFFATATASIMTSSKPIHISHNTYQYEELSIFKMFFITAAVIMANWTMRLFTALQCMTVSGSIAAWYFSEDREQLKSPICRTFFKVIQLHIGTLAYGSLFQPWVAILKKIVNFFIMGQKYDSYILDRLIYASVTLESFSKNAFIETALHGQPFSTSGTRAFNVLITKAPGAIAIATKADCVLFLMQFFLIIFSWITSSLMLTGNECVLSVQISFLINVVIIIVFFETFEIIEHTLLICVCEDQLINNGTSRPYCMSEKLRDIIEKSKQTSSQQRWV